MLDGGGGDKNRLFKRTQVAYKYIYETNQKLINAKLFSIHTHTHTHVIANKFH